jgi:hypothetical protein
VYIGIGNITEYWCGIYLESFVYKGFLDVNRFERRYRGLARPSAVTICITVLYYRRSILRRSKQGIGRQRPTLVVRVEKGSVIIRHKLAELIEKVS